MPSLTPNPAHWISFRNARCRRNARKTPQNATKLRRTLLVPRTRCSPAATAGERACQVNGRRSLSTSRRRNLFALWLISLAIGDRFSFVWLKLNFSIQFPSRLRVEIIAKIKSGDIVAKKCEKRSKVFCAEKEENLSPCVSLYLCGRLKNSSPVCACV